MLRTNQGGFTENLVQVDATATFATILAMVPAAEQAAFLQCQNQITAGLPAFTANRLARVRRWWRAQCPRLLFRTRREHYVQFIDQELANRALIYQDERGNNQQIRAREICTILDPNIVEQQRELNSRTRYYPVRPRNEDYDVNYYQKEE